LKTRKNILISPLDWGLGHAARIIPLAEGLAAGGHNVIIAGAERFRAFFAAELPGISFIAFPGFTPRYSSSLPQYLVLLFQVPSLVFHSVREHLRLRRLLTVHDIDIVISDNRFGLWNRKVKSVYITHQLTIPFPPPFRFLESLGRALHGALISRYSICLIPDLPGSFNLAGRLAHGMKLPAAARYAGVLSRFSSAAGDGGSGRPATAERILVMLSGPEPQRSLLATRLHEFLSRSGLPVIILGGETQAGSIAAGGNIEYISRPGGSLVRDLVLDSRYIISRAGYTTIMELAALGRTALLIPVPGQTEQEYLASYLSGKGLFKIHPQNSPGTPVLVKSDSVDFPASLAGESERLLRAALEEISGE
jgi:predicted glycosyltransferase